MSEAGAEYQRRAAAVEWLQHVARESGACIEALAARIAELEAELREREAVIAGLLPYAESRAEELLELADAAAAGATYDWRSHVDAEKAGAAVEAGRRFLPLRAEGQGAVAEVKP